MTEQPVSFEGVVDDLTLGELKVFEKLSGSTISQMTQNMGVAHIVALAYVVRKRSEPTVTVNDIEKLKLSDVMAMLGVDKAAASNGAGDVDAFSLAAAE